MYAAGPGKNDKYYQILGVSKNSLPSALKKAYKKTAIQIHPDKGGDSEKFKELAEAYQVLSDPVKRRIYDQYGEDALKKEGCCSRSSSSHMMRQHVVYPVAVSLEDLYSGTTLTICSKCKGKGSKSGASMKCSGCLGSGVKPFIVRLGPPMIDLPTDCDVCEGTGEVIHETINEEDPCEQCKGEKVLFGTKILKIHVEKGMQRWQMIKCPTDSLGEGEPDTFFVLQQEEHPKFKRICDDLFVEHTLSLKEALCGFQFVLAHLDNRQLIIKSEPGEVVKPGQVKVINGEGMPMYQRPFMRGKLHIHFTVEFPDSLTPDLSELIEAVVTRDPHHSQQEVETATSPRGARRFPWVDVNGGSLNARGVNLSYVFLLINYVRECGMFYFKTIK